MAVAELRTRIGAEVPQAPPPELLVNISASALTS